MKITKRDRYKRITARMTKQKRMTPKRKRAFEVARRQGKLKFV